MKKLIFFLALIAAGGLFLGISFSSNAEECCAKCTGSANCRACKNCKYCGHCNSGGTCGVCSSVPSSKTYYKPSTTKTAVVEPKQNSKKYYVKPATLNVRSGASTSYSIVQILKVGDDVEIIETYNSGWVKIKFLDSDGETITGYVMKSYLTENKPKTN